MQCKLDEQTITNIIKRHIKPIEKQKRIKLFICYTKFKTSTLIVKNNTNSANIFLNQINAVYKFISLFRECLQKNKYSYVGYTNATLSRRLIDHFFLKNSYIKQHLIIKLNNITDQITFSDVKKILTDYTISINKNNDKNDYKSQKQCALKYE